jgi:colicin import membrane protein
MEGYDGGFGIPQDPYDPIYRKIPTAEEEKEIEQQKIRSAAFMKNYWKNYEKEQARAAKAYAARKAAANKAAANKAAANKAASNKAAANQAAGNAAFEAAYGNSNDPWGQEGGRKTRKSSKRRSRSKARKAKSSRHKSRNRRL